MQYGIDGKVKYSYDEFDRVIGVKYDAETADRYTYEYGANGQTAEVTDNNLNRVARTEYDLADRPCLSEQKDTQTGEILYRTKLVYDKLNNLQQFSERVGATTHTSGYTYDRDNRVTEIAYDGDSHKVGYTYDALGRMTGRTAESGVANGKLTSSYSYVSGGYGTNSTTPLVAGITQSTPAGAAMNYAYTYDNRGNIASETRNGQTTTYEYDAIGQLIRVNDPWDQHAGTNGTTWVYSYDRGGNILSKTAYAYTTGTPGAAVNTYPYTYGDSNWKDKLTAYNGTAISYDAIGNPLSDGTWSYTWGAGRQLRQMSKTGMTVQFKYDHNGLRTQKIVTENGVTTTTNYVLHGKLVTHMPRGFDVLHIFCILDETVFYYLTTHYPCVIM